MPPAASGCHTLAIPAATLRDCLGRHRSGALALAELIMARLARATDALRAAMFADAPARVAAKLCDIADSQGLTGPQGVRMTVPLTQEQLARMAGATRETVNRVLRSFVSNGWVSLSGGRYLLHDPVALRERAGL